MKPDKAVKKKKRLQSSYINIPPLQHVHAGLKMELTAAEASFLVLFGIVSFWMPGRVERHALLFRITNVS